MIDKHIAQCLENSIGRTVQFGVKYDKINSSIIINTDIIEDELATFDADRFTDFMDTRELEYSVDFVNGHFQIIIF